MLTPAERIRIRQIIRPTVEQRAQFKGLLDWLTDVDAIANVRVNLARWEEVQTSRKPKELGLTRADVVEFDPSQRCEALCLIERTIRRDLAICLDFEIQEVFAF